MTLAEDVQTDPAKYFASAGASGLLMFSWIFVHWAILIAHQHNGKRIEFKFSKDDLISVYMDLPLETDLALFRRWIEAFFSQPTDEDIATIDMMTLPGKRFALLVAAAASEKLEIQVGKGKDSFLYAFKKGKKIFSTSKPEISEIGELRITCEPDSEIFGAGGLPDLDMLRMVLKQYAFLNSHTLIELQIEGLNLCEKYKFQDGISSYLESINSSFEKLHSQALSFRGISERLSIECSLQLTLPELQISESNLHCFINSLAVFESFFLENLKSHIINCILDFVSLESIVLEDDMQKYKKSMETCMTGIVSIWKSDGRSLNERDVAELLNVMSKEIPRALLESKRIDETIICNDTTASLLRL